MSNEVMRTLIRRSMRYAEDDVSFFFQGGEPALAGLPFFQAFVEEVRRLNARNLPVNYAIQTNGYKLDDELLDFFKKHNFLIGISLDGTQVIHDRYRVDINDQGTYNEVLATIGKLKDRGMDFNVLCVITEDLARHPRDVWNALKPYSYLQFIPCIDGFSRDAQEYSLQPETYGRFLIELYDCYEQALRWGQYVSERRFDNYLMMLNGYPPEECGMSGSCGGYFLCEADGSIYPCDFYVLDEWRMGNIMESSLFRLEKGERALTFHATSLLLPEECTQCKWKELCRGDCRRERETPNGISRFCESYKMFFEARLDRMKDMAMKVRAGLERSQSISR